jgi:hypothetical protein
MVQDKGKVVSVLNYVPRHEGVLGEWRYSSAHSLTSALDGGEWSASRLGRFIPRKRAPGTHWIGGWVGPRAVLDAVVNRKIPSPSRKSNPRTPIVQPVAQHYTDWAITAILGSKVMSNLTPRIPYNTRQFKEFRAEVKNARSHTSTPPTRPHGVAVITPKWRALVLLRWMRH